MGISKEQWTVIEKKLRGFFSEVVFEYEGHKITVQKGFIRENVMRLVVYIDGAIKAKDSLDLDGTGFNPLVVLFWRRRERYALPKKYREAFIRYNKAMRIDKSEKENDPERKTVSYQPDFATAKSLVRQFRVVEGLTLVGGVDNVDGGNGNE